MPDSIPFPRESLNCLVVALKEEDWEAVLALFEQMLGPVSAVLLYGSRSRGEQHAHSD